MSPASAAPSLPEASSSCGQGKGKIPLAEPSPQSAELTAVVPAEAAPGQLLQEHSERPPPTPKPSEEASPSSLFTGPTLTDSVSVQELSEQSSSPVPPLPANGGGPDVQQQDQGHRGSQQQQQKQLQRGEWPGVPSASQQQRQLGGWPGVPSTCQQQQRRELGEASFASHQSQQQVDKGQGHSSASQQQQLGMGKGALSASLQVQQQQQQDGEREEVASACQQPHQLQLPLPLLQPQPQSQLPSAAADADDPAAVSWAAAGSSVLQPAAAAAAVAAPGMQTAAAASNPATVHLAQQLAGLNLTDQQLQQVTAALLRLHPLPPAAPAAVPGTGAAAAAPAADPAAAHLVQQLAGIDLTNQQHQQGAHAAATGPQPPSAAAAVSGVGAAAMPAAEPAAVHLAQQLAGVGMTAQLQQVAAAATGPHPPLPAAAAAAAAAPAGPVDAAAVQPHPQLPAAGLHGVGQDAAGQSMAAPDVLVLGASAAAAAAAAASAGTQEAPAAPDPATALDAEQLAAVDTARQKSQHQGAAAAAWPKQPPPSSAAVGAAQAGGPSAAAAAAAGGPFGAAAAAAGGPFAAVAAAAGGPTAAAGGPFGAAAAAAGGPFAAVAAAAGGPTAAAAGAAGGPFGAAAAAAGGPFATVAAAADGPFAAVQAPGAVGAAAGAVGAAVNDAGPVGAVQAPGGLPYNPNTFGMVVPRPQEVSLQDRLDRLQQRLQHELRSRPLPALQQPLSANELPLAAGPTGRHIVDPGNVFRRAKGLAVKQAYDLRQAVKYLDSIAVDRQRLAEDAEELRQAAEAAAAAAAAEAERLAWERCQQYAQQYADQPDNFEDEYQGYAQSLAAIPSAARPPMLQMPPLPESSAALAGKAQRLAAQARAAADAVSAALVAARAFAAQAALTAHEVLEIKVCSASEVIRMDGLELSTNSDRYLGAGAYAKVFCGLVGSPVPVAVKAFQPGFGNAPDAIATMFMRELQLQALICNPHIVKVTAICFDPPMIIMDECDTSLGDYLRNHTAAPAAAEPAAAAAAAPAAVPAAPQLTSYPPYSWPLLVNLATQAAAGLAALHEPPLGILHNDVRADNMLLVTPSQQQQIRAKQAGREPQMKLQLCDFGLAEFVGHGEAAVVPQVTNRLWLPPDMGSGPQGWHVNQKTDVFALGCVLEEMMIGPYPNNRPEQDYPRQMPTPGSWLSALRGTDPPQDFAQVYRSCVNAAAVHRPTAQVVKGWLGDL